MQGVRTTRGCMSCRKRKKGCDLKAPCGRCVRLSTTCRYEEQRWTFVPQPSEYQVDALQSVPSGPSQTSLNNTNAELQAAAEFWDLYLPHEDAGLDGSIGGVLAAPWILTVQSLAEENQDVRVALRACTYAGLGWMREDSALIQYSTKLYGWALSQTNKALQDPVSAQSDDVLAICRLLSLFEVFRRSQTPAGGSEQVNDWRSHVEGTCRMVEFRGRDKHLSGHGIHLYDGVRMSAMAATLARRQPNAFNRLDWNLPKLTIRDELFDLVNPVPALLQRCDEFHAATSPDGGTPPGQEMVQSGHELLQECLAICHELRSWEIRALEMCRESRVERRRSLGLEVPANYHDLSSLFVVSKSHGIGFFFICTQYWAIGITVFSTTRRLYQQLSTNSDLESTLPDWIDPEPLALNIAQTASTYFTPEAGVWAAQSATFPLGTAMGFYARTGRVNSPPFKMIVAAFSETNSGAIMRDFLQNVVGRSIASTH